MNKNRFAYNYLSGTRLLEKLVFPNNMSLTQTYEATRDLIVSMHYKRNTTGIVERITPMTRLGVQFLVKRHATAKRKTILLVTIQSLN